MRKVFLEDLPKKKGFGANKDKEIVDWKNSTNRYIKFIYEDLSGEIYIKNYNSKNQKLTVVYNARESEILTASFKDGGIGCIVGKIINYHMHDVNAIVNGSIILEHIKMKEKIGYKVQCVVDGHIRNVNQYDLNNNKGCPVCSGHKVEKGINDLATTHPNLVKYFVNIEDAYTCSFGSEKVVLLKCVDCGLEKSMPVKDLTNQGFACNRCSDGIHYPNRFMYNLLKQLDIDFVTEYAPIWAIDDDGCQRRYDFYIESRRLIIEMDGGLHYRDNGISGKTKQEILQIDTWKDVVSLNHNIEVVRIDCNYKGDRLEYVKNNVLHKLSNVFNLCNVKWDLIDEMSLKNKVKEVCDLWNTKGYESTSKLCKDTNLSKYTILRYLKKGNELGWCNYDAQEEIEKNNKRPRIYVKKEKTLENISDMTREICKLWEDGIHSTTEIANIIGATNTAIIVRHLMIGYGLGICSYTKESAIKYKYAQFSIKRKDTITEVTRNVCDLWNMGIHSTVNISEKLGISRETALYNLKKGTKLGICDYSVDLAKENRGDKISKTSRNNSKKVMVVGYDIIYNSIKDLCDVSDDVFGVKFNPNNVCQVCNGGKKSHKGYKFEYVL